MANLISRWLTRRGYGVQSPFAYHIVRNVIVECLPFYAYDELRERFGKRKNEHFLQLMLRLANEVQPATYYLSKDVCTEPLTAYIHAGSHNSKAVENVEPQAIISLLVAAYALEAENFYQHISEGGCLVVTNISIHRNKWKQLCKNLLRASFTVFDCGKYALAFRKKHLHPTLYSL